MDILNPYRRKILCVALLLLISCESNLDDNCLNPKSNCFVPDTAPPVLLSSIPAGAATQVSPCSGTPCRGQIVLLFNESMNTALSQTLTTAIYNGSSYVSTPNTGTTFTWSTTRAFNDTLTIQISWYWFPENSQIQWSLAAAGLQDTAGHAIAADVTRSFTTTAPRAGFTVTDTGQTQCRAGATGTGALAACSDGSVTVMGQDGHYANIPAARSFTGPALYGASDYTTTDNATGLVWKTCTEGLTGSTCGANTVTNMTWYNALNRCAALNTANYGGKTNWRLPTSIELESISNAGNASPAIDTAYFPATVSNSYWSSSTNIATATQAWHTSFSFGTSFYDLKSLPYAVRCIASASPVVTPTFTDNNDGTVSDGRTNLRWQKCSNGQNNDATCSGATTTTTWLNAMTYCQGLSLAGKSWRLPSKNELLSIADKGKQPAIDLAYFPVAPSAFYWVSTNFPSATVAWDIDLADGSSGNVAKTATTHTARCVTDGP